jgi:hypothetical protein
VPVKSANIRLLAALQSTFGPGCIDFFIQQNIHSSRFFHSNKNSGVENANAELTPFAEEKLKQSGIIPGMQVWCSD